MARKQRRTRYACDINGEHFATAKALGERCRAIIDKYEFPGCPPELEMSDEDAGFFVELVRLRDPDRVPSGCYVMRVLRSNREGQIKRHVKFIYSNGDGDLIGWSKLCGGKPCDATTVSAAMRESVRAQVQQVWSDFFKSSDYGICPMSGRAISSTGELCDDRAVVHHDGMSFSEIRDSWLREMGMKASDVPLRDLFDGGGYEVAAGDLAESWKQYHASHASLVVVSEHWHRNHHGLEAKGRDSNGSATNEGTTSSGRVGDSDKVAVDPTLDRLGLHGLRRRQKGQEGSATAGSRPRNELQRPGGVADVRRSDVGVRPA